MPADYRSTVFLPHTDFPMKAGLPQAEPVMLERWREMNLFQRLRDDARGREKFILHDGPPYANGHLHIGHALNKILKDVVNRSQQMMGKDANYVPGWDCHGLPIEWQIELKYRKAGKDKDEVPVLEFRDECRHFADEWIGIQSEEFQRLGVVGDWDNPYSTMAYSAETAIAGELLKFVMNGGLYRGSKPVMWSPVEKTALAEAEVEYHDHDSTTIFVRFPVVEGPSEISGAAVVIWTTTPWTMPGNRAVAVAEDQAYVRLKVTEIGDGSLARVGEEMILAMPLVDQVCAEVGITGRNIVAEFSGSVVAGAILSHPWRGQGYDFDVPVLAANFVEMDTGSGFVHIAPGHGDDDFVLGQKHGIEVPHTVAEGGTFLDHIPMFAGLHVYKADDPVCDAMIEASALLGRGKITHSYPHSWRSKAPLIYRNTPQWFISMDTNDLRAKALASIEQVRWVPNSGRNRIRSMIENRPAWVVSRQRSWGVPITVFYDKETSEPLRDEAVNQRILEAFSAKGGDCWYDGDPKRFLGPDHDPDKYEAASDTLDVWFDSGSTHTYVLENNPDLAWPASLYLEGSDQHRGWFHSSLLESSGTRERAPYDAVLTHGFVMASDGRKMSKSIGNVIAPQKIIDQYGADILRQWVVSSDYSEDLRIGDEIIKGSADAYRKLRNTLRFLLGNLSDFSDDERIDPAEMPELDRWVLHRLSELDAVVRQTADDFEFHKMFVALYNFCTVDLSSFYFDIRKDSLYCDGKESVARRSVRTVLDHVFNHLTAWLAPILCFTAEEAWQTRNPDMDSSVHLRQYENPLDTWANPDLAEKWDRVRTLRKVVTGALEVERREKRIGASLQAHAHVYGAQAFRDAVDSLDFAEVCIASGLTFHDGGAPDGAFTLDDVADVGVVIEAAPGEKCRRCWKVLEEVSDPHPDLCNRCANTVGDH